MKKRKINPDPLGGDTILVPSSAPPGEAAPPVGPEPPPTFAGAEGPVAALDLSSPPPPAAEAGSPPDLQPPELMPLSAAPSFAGPALDLGPPAAPLPAAPLEERVRRLEDALAQLQDLKGIETRVADRVAEHLLRERQPVLSAPPPAPSPPSPIRQVPVASPAPPSLTGPAVAAVLVDVGKRLLNASAGGPAEPPPPTPRPPNAAAQRVWLLWDTIAEARAIARMYVDPRYRMPWLGRLLPIVLLAAFLGSYYWAPFTSIPVIGWLLNKVLDLVLAFVLFKVLGHEARRYRETAPDLPPNLRL